MLLSPIKRAPFKTGQISNDTKVGRLANMFHHEVLLKKEVFNFSAFGDNLIGRTIKALSIAQDFSRDVRVPGKILFLPILFDTPSKRRGDIPSVRFIIQPGDSNNDVFRSDKVIKIASTAVPDSIAKDMHDMYMKNMNLFTLRCIGETQCGKAVLSMAEFNKNVNSHKLWAWMSHELVPDSFRSNGSTIRSMVFNVEVVKTEETKISPEIFS